jgi:hypothetical protein
MGLPDYRPPRFQDDAYTHEIVPDLERKHHCTIRFIGVNVDYPQDWEVRVDEETVMRIGRHRDGNGNTVYEMTAEEFRIAIEDELERRRE